MTCKGRNLLRSLENDTDTCNCKLLQFLSECVPTFLEYLQINTYNLFSIDVLFSKLYQSYLQVIDVTRKAWVVTLEETSD